MTIQEYESTLTSPLRKVTLCFLVKDNEVLLATKKVRFGAGRITGIGGKVEGSENPLDAIKREVFEEIQVKPVSIKEVGLVYFYNPYQTENFVEKNSGRTYGWDSVSHIYICDKWEGTPQETEEMSPQWFPIFEVPYDRMWSDAKFWLPKVLEGNSVQAKFIFTKEFEIEDKEVSH
jgi:8-oxo-dGTP diphosphatase